MTKEPAETRYLRTAMLAIDKLRDLHLDGTLNEVELIEHLERLMRYNLYIMESQMAANAKARRPIYERIAQLNLPGTET